MKQLQCIKPVQRELRRLETIRALAATCRGPLEEFLEKIQKFEDHLGPRNPNVRTFSTLTRRVQWSLKYENEVKSLRAQLAPNLATITVLLVTQTIDSVSNFEEDSIRASEVHQKSLEDVKRTASDIAVAQDRLEAEHSRLNTTAVKQEKSIHTLRAKVDALLRDHASHGSHLQNQAMILEDIRKKGTAIDLRTRQSHVLIEDVRQDTAEIKAVVPSILGRILSLSGHVTAGLLKIQDIRMMISQMIQILAEFSAEMRETMKRLIEAFRGIQRHLARLERFLPQVIDLPIVRFRDAFNVTRAFLYDLCKEWQTFQALIALAFINR